MSPCILPSQRLLAAAGCALLVVGMTQAQSASPFMPPAAASSVAPTAGAPIEFRGFMETADGVQFRIYDPARKAGTWAKLNVKDPTLDLTVKKFNATPDSETLVVEHQGRTLTLAQRVPKVVSSGSAVQNMPSPPPTMVNVPPAVTQSVVVNPTPADEAKRLQSVADEVARRRALREQAAQQMNQGVQPAQPQVQPAQTLPQGTVNNLPAGSQPRGNPRQRP
ncbi:MAG: hypothetical protein NTV51_09795 [Verrucomicrobia bacterium]|nr:hypothetical protein [Verrucomicrobiota bacterium]